MSEERLKRKITIILATDVFGYSKHIEEDETLTIKTYNDREVILLNLIKEFRGRVFIQAVTQYLQSFPVLLMLLNVHSLFKIKFIK